VHFCGCGHRRSGLFRVCERGAAVARAARPAVKVAKAGVFRPFALAAAAQRAATHTGERDEDHHGRVGGRALW